MLFKKNISKELKNEAVRLGLCTEWTNEWGNPTKEELVNKFIRGIDWCIRKNYPSCEYMKKHFDGVMQKYGVFVDDKIDLENHSMLIANGKTSGKIVYDSYAVGTIYARHDSDLIIEVSGNAFVAIETYDNCNISVFQRDKAKVFVYNHGGNIQTSGKVVVKNRKAPN